ncbi:cellulose biosynthesis cyclic di-GMP-binding regulatory protein BcsB [Paraburkholderia sp. C35]|uniref:cellulose biosynthesis cyclic di-GMP-binding regulatory protein BcsB n=1 Tax=Paraburkholderia sp. C35 TaxID=2126993 RepID=UPI000D697010|nr:cellulose biosynthesis cyclic di-GMP-binding regulatory protein BcsB [Paraburkholderia sp. C35]
MIDTLSRGIARVRPAFAGISLCSRAQLFALFTTVLVSVPAFAAGAFDSLNQSVIETRTVTLRQLGLLSAVSLTAPDTRREFFLPVPADVPLTDAALQFDGGYVRGDGGRTTMLVSLDGSPVAARALDKAEGGVTIDLGVDGAPRSVGFVRLGLGYASVINDNVCTDQTAIGNVLRVDPSTRLTYRFDPADVRDIRTAWSALPYAPVLTIAGRSLTAASLDNAWRTDALLQRDGKRPLTQAMPAVGSKVDLSALNAPASLRGIPAFDALAAAASAPDAQKHVIANAAELGALLALAPRRVFGPDVIVADDALRASFNAALNALRAQIAQSSAAALPSFDAWRDHSASQIVAPLAAGEVRVAHYGGRAVIAVGDNAGVAVLARSWRSIDISRRVVVHQIDTGERLHGDAILLSDLGGEPRSVDVHSTAAWEASFDLAAASGNGKLPDEVVLDLAASPTLSNGAATATVYFNDVMIGAKLLDIDGKRERLSLKIPRYALARTNDLRVTFRRQPDAGCQARQSYPVAVLPSSYLKLADGTPGKDFVGMAARYASSATVIVPQSYLDNAVDSVPRLAVLTGAAGVAPLPAKFSVVANGASANPSGPFLAADVPLADEHDPVSFSADRLSLKSSQGDRLIDVSGLTRLAVLSVASSGDANGIVYRSTGESPVLTDKLQLSRGNIAVVDSTGVLKRFDTVNPDDLAATGTSSTEWVTHHWARWGIPFTLMLLLLLLILVAQMARRRRRAARNAATAQNGNGNGSDNGNHKPQDKA